MKKTMSLFLLLWVFITNASCVIPQITDQKESERIADFSELDYPSPTTTTITTAAATNLSVASEISALRSEISNLRELIYRCDDPVMRAEYEIQLQYYQDQLSRINALPLEKQKTQSIFDLLSNILKMINDTVRNIIMNLGN